MESYDRHLSGGQHTLKLYATRRYEVWCLRLKAVDVFNQFYFFFYSGMFSVQKGFGVAPKVGFIVMGKLGLA
jgi:hypothetical protein